MSVRNSHVLHETITSLDISDDATVARLVDLLDEHSKAMAADEQLRREVGNGVPDLWSDLRGLWTAVATTTSEIGSDEDENESEDVAATSLRLLCVSLAKFTRNLVAAVPENQSRAYDNEAAIRQLLRHYTSYAEIITPESYTATRMLTQALSNIVTANEYLIEKLWTSYLRLPEEQLILIRLISTPDAGTVLASFVLILNCLRGSLERTTLLVNSPNGPRICITYLDRMASLFDAADEQSTRSFELGYRIFSNWLDENFIPAIYNRIGITTEIVTPHQTTLLKLLDAYLQPSNFGHISAPPQHLSQLCQLMIEQFFSLADYTQQSIRRALGSYKSRSAPFNSKISGGANEPPRGAVNESAAQPLEELDLLLPKVCEALVLVTQCLVSLALFSEEGRHSRDPLLHPQDSPGISVLNFKESVNSAISVQRTGFIECLVETLHLLDQFLPRIAFGKVAPPPVHVGESHAQSSDHTAEKSDNSFHPQGTDPKGFAYVKRDLVRLLGILVADDRAVQDRVRNCGGILVVLNMCVIDERNPYLREHAILALRNLLHSNLENQAVVNEIQPLGEWEKPIVG